MQTLKRIRKCNTKKILAANISFGLRHRSTVRDINIVLKELAEQIANTDNEQEAVMLTVEMDMLEMKKDQINSAYTVRARPKKKK